MLALYIYGLIIDLLSVSHLVWCTEEISWGNDLLHMHVIVMLLRWNTYENHGFIIVCCHVFCLCVCLFGVFMCVRVSLSLLFCVFMSVCISHCLCLSVFPSLSFRDGNLPAFARIPAFLRSLGSFLRFVWIRREHFYVYMYIITASYWRRALEAWSCPPFYPDSVCPLLARRRTVWKWPSVASIRAFRGG